MGATKVAPGKTVYDPEVAANDPINDPYSIAYSSGGGFSNIFPQPSYQAAGVANYFKISNPPYAYYSELPDLNSTAAPDYPLIGKNGGLYNRIGRGQVSNVCEVYEATTDTG